jgi:hypothetical protein
LTKRGLSEKHKVNRIRNASIESGLNERKRVSKRSDGRESRGINRKSKKIKDKSLQSQYVFGVLLSFVAIAAIVFLSLMLLFFWLAIEGQFNFLLSFSGESRTLAFFIFFFVFVLGFSTPILVVAILSIMRFFEKYLGNPTREEIIFAECFIIAKYLTVNERDKAKKEVAILLSTLTSFVRNLYFNPRRKVYAPEFDKLRCGRNQISRMVMFSEMEYLPYLLRDFGFAFIRNDSPEAFSSLNQLIKEVEKYGELKGRIGRFLSGLERYPNSLPWLIPIVIIVIGIVYYLLSGQRLPTG